MFWLLIAGTMVLFSNLFAQPVVPKWARDAVWYQIFPERFANGDTANDPPNVQPWGGTPEKNNYFGGDLKGIIDHLDYIQNLGVNAIYLNPIFESPTNHKYHTTDYLKIDHNFGNEEMFKQLLDECHKRGIKVVLDGVFGYSGNHFFAFEDLKKKGKKSKYRKWYNVKSFPVGPPEKPNYEAWRGIGEFPKLMTMNPEVRKYLFDVASYWTKLGIDGWRLNAPNEIPHDFWIEWRKLVKSINPDAFIVGEIWDDATPWLKGDEFDAVMNYRFRDGCAGFLALENRNAAQFDTTLQKQRAAYPSTVNYVLQNLLGSHDTERFLTLCNDDVSKMKLAVLMQMTYLGAPMIYYGDEIGMTGGKDPDCRKTMIWDSARWNNDLLSWYRQLITIRKNYEVLRSGEYATILVDSVKKTFGFKRDFAGEKALVFLNAGSEPLRLEGRFPFLRVFGWYDLIADYKRTTVRTLDRVVVAPHSGIILYCPIEE